MSKKFRFKVKENFGLKLLSAFIVVIIVVLSAFTLFAMHHESKKAKEDLREQGEMLSGLLARGSTVGVFAENEKMLKDATDGLMGIKDVVSVLIYNANLKMLYAKEKTSLGTHAFPVRTNAVDDLMTAQAISIEETAYAFEFFRPVVIKSASGADESLYFGHTIEDKPEKVIGYIKIVLSKDSYHKEILSILSRNLVIMLIFIFSSVVIVYLAVKKVTRPLEKLTESVKALGKGMLVEPVLVETPDELGNLASAFNAMVVARGQAEESLRESEHRSRLIEENERRRIAIDLHDTIGQMLAISKIKLGALREAAPPGGFADSLDEVRARIDQSIQYTRSLTTELSPPVLYELGLESAIEALAVQIQQQHGIFVNVEKQGWAGKELSDEMRLPLFKTVRELLINVVKHAGAHTATISIDGDLAYIRITVEDDGIGFNALKTGSLAGKPGGFGLFSIRERLKYLGGQFEMYPASGKGTRVVVTAPRKGPGKKEAGIWSR